MKNNSSLMIVVIILIVIMAVLLPIGTGLTAGNPQTEPTPTSPVCCWSLGMVVCGMGGHPNKAYLPMIQSAELYHPSK